MPKGKGTFQVHLVLYEVTNEGSDNEEWAIESQEPLDTFDTYEKAEEWLQDLADAAKNDANMR